jgi:hypothetical protein
MDVSKRKQIEDKLRQLLATANQDRQEPECTKRPIPGAVQVIRRSKGQPDRHILASGTTA